MKKQKTESVYSKEVIRLNRLIAESGLSSRRKADELIRSGVVRVNGKIVTQLGTVVSLSDLVTVEGKPIKILSHYTYILLNTPKDTITTTNDERNRKTVVDLIKTKSRVFPVGRLDRNTTGVLLLTNDGELANRLMHPKYRIQRVYRVGLNRSLEAADAATIAKGVTIEDVQFNPCEIIIDYKNPQLVTVILTEGKNHEIKKLFEYFNYEVKKLDRKAFANITTRGLKRGEWRHLTRQEVRDLKHLVGLL
jgi:23S rRNA pseudouridine2605 synthase